MAVQFVQAGRALGLARSPDARAKAFLVETKQPRPIKADGEIVTQTPARFEIMPKALEVFISSNEERPPATKRSDKSDSLDPSMVRRSRPYIESSSRLAAEGRALTAQVIGPSPSVLGHKPRKYRATMSIAQVRKDLAAGAGIEFPAHRGLDYRIDAEERCLSPARVPAASRWGCIDALRSGILGHRYRGRVNLHSLHTGANEGSGLAEFADIVGGALQRKTL